MAFIATFNLTFDLYIYVVRLNMFLYIYIIVFKFKNVIYLTKTFYCNSSTTIL